MTPALSSLWFLTIVNAMEDMGLSRDRAIAHVTGNALELRNPRFRVPLDSLEKTLRLAARELKIENIGLEMTFRARVTGLAESGSIMALCDTLIEATELNNQNSVLAESIGTPTLVRREGRILMVWNPVFTDYAKYRHVSELVFGGYIITMNWLSWCFKRGVKSVSFRHNAPVNSERHEFICKCPVVFNGDEFSLEIDEEFADLPLPTANPEKLIKIRKILEKSMNNIAHQSTLELETFAVVVDAINNGRISRSIVADKMGLDERTFQRRLQSKRLTYREILDNVRQTMCRDFVKKGLNFADIAQLLCYNDQSAFTRAFKKWHGVAPSQYTLQRIVF